MKVEISMCDMVEQLIEKIKFEAEGIYSYVVARQSDLQAEYTSEVFDSPVAYNYEMTRLKKVWGRHGVYVFVFTEDMNVSYEKVSDWGKTSGAGFNGQWSAHEIKQGDCLYLGSCVSKSIYSRVGEHYSDKKDRTALKLNHPKRRIFLDKVEVIAFPIKKSYSKDGYKLLLPCIEKELHELFHPLTGSSRV